MIRKYLPWIVLFICIGICIANVKAQNCTNYIMSNYDFTNKVTTFKQIEKAFGHKYSWYDMKYAYDVYRGHGLNPLLFYCVAQKEGRDRNDFMLGVGFHLKDNGWYKSFNAQVWSSAKTLRYWFDYACNDRWWVYIRERHQKVVMYNSATYSLYKYTPHYKIYLNMTKQHHGNYIVSEIWEDVKKQVEVSNGL